MKYLKTYENIDDSLVCYYIYFLYEDEKGLWELLDLAKKYNFEYKIFDKEPYLAVAHYEKRGQENIPNELKKYFPSTAPEDWLEQTGMREIKEEDVPETLARYKFRI